MWEDTIEADKFELSDSEGFVSPQEVVASVSPIAITHAGLELVTHLVTFLGAVVTDHYVTMLSYFFIVLFFILLLLILCGFHILHSDPI